MFHWIMTCMAAALFVAPGGENTAGLPEFDLRWHTVDGGGVTFSSGGDFELGSTIGQPDAGPVLTGGAFVLNGGFWFQAVPGDCNTDSGINLFDFEGFADCVSGPDEPAETGTCWCADFDDDSDVDLNDYAGLQNGFSGE